MYGESITTPKQFTLGDLIDALRAKEATDDVRYDFCGFDVGSLDSYRGYYDHLALGFSEDGPGVKVGDLLAECERAVGATFDGYKGGSYLMDRDTPLWVANYGSSHGTAIVGVIDGVCGPVLATALID